MEPNSRFIVPNSAAQERVVSLEGTQPFRQNTFSMVWILNKYCIDDDTFGKLNSSVKKSKTETNSPHFIPAMQGLL